MTENLSIGSVNFSNVLNKNNFQNSEFISDDISIFDAYSNDTDDLGNELEALNEKLDSVEAENGAILSAWNNFKEVTGVGTSVEKCDEAIDKYENGEITYEEASEIIDEYSEKQDSSLNLFSNIATSISAIAAVAGAAAITAATGGAALPILAAVGIGAATGAVTKAGFKTIDRATNDVEGDAADGKQIARDALSGAIVGGTAAATMGTAGGANGVTDAAIGCTKTGVITGSVAGSSNYLLDCTFDEDKDFCAKDFVITTGTNAVTCGIVGGIMGSFNGLLRSCGLLTAGCDINSMVSSVENASIKNVAADSACTTAYKILNDRVSSIITA